MKMLRVWLAALLLALAPLPAYSVGTIFGLPLSQQVDEEGDPLSGALLFIYDANTSTPVTIYSDSALTVETSNPIVADSAGRLPEFWLEDGDYRVRLTTDAGVAIFDQLSVTALGPSSGEGGGGGVDDNALLATGDLKFRFGTGALAGFVRANGRTIGSASSGATERANADTQALYEFTWNNCGDSICAVAGGRGANAAADFAANKAIAVWDMRDRAPFGASGMGNTSTGTLSDTVGTAGGAATSTALIAHTHGAGSYAAASHTHNDGTLKADSHRHNDTIARRTLPSAGGTSDADRISLSNTDGSTGNFEIETDLSGELDVTGVTGSPTTDSTPDVSGTSGSTGSGSSFSIMPPWRVGTWYLRL